MGFFEDLGRKVGQFTQEAKETAAGEAPYGCRDCGKRFYTEQGECPQCGSENVAQREPRSDADENGEREAGTDATGSSEAADEVTSDSSDDSRPE